MLGQEYNFYSTKILYAFWMEHTFTSYPGVTFQSPKKWKVEGSIHSHIFYFC